MTFPIQFMQGLINGQQQKPALAGAGGGGSGAGTILSDTDFQARLKQFAPQYNTAYNQQRLDELAKNGQQRGWEYQMLSDQQRNGWNVPQGNIAMSAGDQHVAQLTKFADKGVIPDADLLATAKHYDEQWQQGGPATKLPMISAYGGGAVEQAAAPSEVQGPRGVTGAGGNWGTAGGADPAQWAHNYQGDQLGPYANRDANSVPARLMDANRPVARIGTPYTSEEAVSGQVMKSEQFDKTGTLMKGPLDFAKTPGGTATLSNPYDPRSGPAMGLDGFLQRSGSPTPYAEQLAQEKKAFDTATANGPYMRNMTPAESAFTNTYSWLRQKFFPTQNTIPLFYSPFGNFKIGGH